MKNYIKTNETDAKGREMTFADYYGSIPSFPRRNFIREICSRCEVNEGTARNWVSNRSKPQKRSHYLILSEMTGIPPEMLFAE